ncbi:MAG TPA: Uma2 family endonuclease [Thermoanaerobaculia bacterium]|nr:Uma2 family endonuclease [Thermoanaerobaculia bacterium]
MSQPAFKALDLPFELVYSDGIPLDSYWQRIQMTLLIDVIRQAMEERGRTDFFVSGDMFVYYSPEQARDVAEGRRYFRGPDVFFVDQVEPRKEERKAWVSWEEGGRLPDLIVELLSPSTAKIDRTIKKDLYSRVFRTRDYFLYDLDTATLEGFRLTGDLYQPVKPDSQGRLRSEVLGLDLGLWHGDQEGQETAWARLFYPDGRLVPTLAEVERQRAEAERQRADTERQRAEAAEAELARLRSLPG